MGWGYARSESSKNADEAGAGEGIDPLARVVIDAHVDATRIDTLQVPIEYVLQIIQVVVLRANRVVVRQRRRQSVIPPVVFPHRRSQVAVVRVQDGLEVLGPNLDVRHRVVAVAPVRGTLVTRDLHHSDLARPARRAWVAARLLERDRGEEDGWHAGLRRHVLEHAQVRLAWRKHAPGRREHCREVFVDEVVECDRGWNPA